MNMLYISGIYIISFVFIKLIKICFMLTINIIGKKALFFNYYGNPSLF